MNKIRRLTHTIISINKKKLQLIHHNHIHIYIYYQLVYNGNNKHTSYKI
jgi:hypothetical protein